MAADPRRTDPSEESHAHAETELSHDEAERMVGEEPVREKLHHAPEGEPPPESTQRRLNTAAAIWIGLVIVALLVVCYWLWDWPALLVGAVIALAIMLVGGMPYVMSVRKRVLEHDEAVEHAAQERGIPVKKHHD